jgi:uncharacterized protein
MTTYQTPGVYQEDVFLAPAAELRTGVPAFLGYTTTADLDQAGRPVPVKKTKPLTLWSQFGQRFGAPRSDGYLASAVRGFFENGGSLCYVVRLEDIDNTLTSMDALRQGLDALAPMDTLDLVCAPDIMRPDPNGDLDQDNVRTMQAALLEHCDRCGDRFAILDARPGVTIDEVLGQRLGLSGTNGALYYPWIKVQDGPDLTAGFIPPCGCISGVYARTDQSVGVHKAPANEVLEGVLDLEVNLTNAQQDQLNPMGINCLRAFPGRGIRIWGARTLSSDAAWAYVNVQRLFLTAGRWIERNTAGMVFEPHDTRLWARVGRELTAYFNQLFQQGALKGRTAQEAFYVKCDGETNPPEVRDAGQLVTEIGLAPAAPSEFIVVRIIHGASGVTISGPTRPG